MVFPEDSMVLHKDNTVFFPRENNISNRYVVLPKDIMVIHKENTLLYDNMVFSPARTMAAAAI